MGKKHAYATKAQLERLVLRMHRTGILYSEALEELKKQFILAVLREVDWNQTKAAQKLGMHRNTLVRTLRELGIDVPGLRKNERRPPRGASNNRKNSRRAETGKLLPLDARVSPKLRHRRIKGSRQGSVRSPVPSPESDVSIKAGLVTSISSRSLLAMMHSSALACGSVSVPEKSLRTNFFRNMGEVLL